MSIGLYLHIPFCVKKCNYCDFNSFSLREGDVEGYLLAVKREMALYLESLTGDQKKLASLFIGGGTPTCLSGGQLSALLEELDKLFVMSPDMEITIEANPGTVSKEKLQSLKQAGVNRISLGIQAFNDENLKSLGRIHSALEGEEAFYLMREAGFENINLDLMMALPNQSMENWLSSLEKAISLNPEHISAYSLKIETGTPFHKLYNQGALVLPEEEEEAAFYEATIKGLEASGYEHYEISNFAKVGKRSKHNLTYWLNQEYLGLGPGAHSFLNKVRWANIAELKAYSDSTLKGKLPIDFEEKLTVKEEMAEMVFMGLRLLDGINIKVFEERFNQSIEEVYGKEITKLRTQGLLEYKGDFLRLTKVGLPLANMVFQEFV